MSASVPLFTASLPSPIGHVSFAVDTTGAVVAVTFDEASALARLVGKANKPEIRLVSDPERTASAAAELADYFAGRKMTFDLALAPRIGTEFQQRVWRALSRIPVGTTWSYARLASEVGSVARAVGAANGANPISIIVPCHRVIGANGSLTGYAGGLERKRWLLAHEGAALNLTA